MLSAWHWMGQEGILILGVWKRLGGCSTVLLSAFIEHGKDFMFLDREHDAEPLDSLQEGREVRGVRVSGDCWFSQGKHRFSGLLWYVWLLSWGTVLRLCDGTWCVPTMDSSATLLHPFTCFEWEKVENLLQFCGFGLSVLLSGDWKISLVWLPALPKYTLF